MTLPSIDPKVNPTERRRLGDTALTVSRLGVLGGRHRHRFAEAAIVASELDFRRRRAECHTPASVHDLPVNDMRLVSAGVSASREAARRASPFGRRLGKAAAVKERL